MGRHSGNSALTISFSPPVIRIILEKKKPGCSYFKSFSNHNPDEYYVGVLSMILFVSFSFPGKGEINAKQQSFPRLAFIL